mmetsp:Transcript_127/g.207  ORF Transcript_127/g.207 Transcript_127/m.207 type:complete len:216 (-) Transcript_127:382-1029(-)
MAGSRQEGIGFHRWSICDCQLDIIFLVNGHESLGRLVNFLFVFSPKLAPFHIHHIARGTLAVHERTEGVHVETTAHHTSDGGESWIVPSSHPSLFDKPRELAFGHDGVIEIDARKGVDTDAAQAESLENPLILLIAIIVFGGTQGVRDTLQRIDDWTRQIVGGVGLVGGARAMVRFQVLAEQDWIAHGTIDALHINLGAQTPDTALFGTGAHDFE